MYDEKERKSERINGKSPLQGRSLSWWSRGTREQTGVFTQNQDALAFLPSTKSILKSNPMFHLFKKWIHSSEWSTVGYLRVCGDIFLRANEQQSSKKDKNRKENLAFGQFVWWCVHLFPFFIFGTTFSVVSIGVALPDLWTVVVVVFDTGRGNLAAPATPPTAAFIALPPKILRHDIQSTHGHTHTQTGLIHTWVGRAACN